LTRCKPSCYPVKHRYKDGFNPKITVSKEFGPRVRKILELDMELDRYILSATDHLDLLTEVYASNIYWSTSLEGNPLSEDEVRIVTRDTLSGNMKESRNGPVQEVINHLICLHSPDAFCLPWSDPTICALNYLLLKGTGSSSTIGRYRDEPAMVGEPLTGEEHFIPAPPEWIPKEMSQLIQWTNDQALVYEPIIAATVMSHEFESIHPFADGNGRTGRSLFHLYLQQRALKNSHLCKIDHKLLENKNLYYDLLAYTDQTGSYEELIELVSIAVLKSYEEAQEALSKKDLLSAGLDEASKRLLIKAKARKGYFSRKEAASWVDGMSEQTVGKRLNELEEMGALESTGQTRAKRYRMKDPLANFKAVAMAVRKAESGEDVETPRVPR
jgi:Fic family protein